MSNTNPFGNSTAGHSVPGFSVNDAGASARLTAFALLAQDTLSGGAVDEPEHFIRRVPLHIDPDGTNGLVSEILRFRQSQSQGQQQNSGQGHAQSADDDMMPDLLDVSDSSDEESDDAEGDERHGAGGDDDGSVPSLRDISDSSSEEPDDASDEDEDEREDENAGAANPESRSAQDILRAILGPEIHDHLPPPAFPPVPMLTSLRHRPEFLQRINQLLFDTGDISDPTRAEELMRGLEPLNAELAARFVRAGGDAMCAVCRDDLVAPEPDESRTPLTSVPDLSSPLDADSARSPVQYLDASAHRGPPMPFEQRTPPPTSADILALPCRHAFHAQCLLPWLSRRTTCPSCRLDLDPDSLTLRAPPPGAGLEHYRRLFRHGAAGVHNTIVLADDPPAPAPPAEDAAMSPAEQIRSLHSVSQDLDRVAEMLPRLEESMRALTALANEGLANIHETLAAAPVPVPVGPARVVNDPAQAPLASELGLPMPAPLGPEQASDAPALPQPGTSLGGEQLGLAPVPAPVPSPSELGAPAPAPPQPSAIEGSLLDNEHLRFMLGASAAALPPAPARRAHDPPGLPDLRPGPLQRGHHAGLPTVVPQVVGQLTSSWFATLSASGPMNLAPASAQPSPHAGSAPAAEPASLPAPDAAPPAENAASPDGTTAASTAPAPPLIASPAPRPTLPPNSPLSTYLAATPARPRLPGNGDLAAQNTRTLESLEASVRQLRAALADTERAAAEQRQRIGVPAQQERSIAESAAPAGPAAASVPSASESALAEAPAPHTVHSAPAPAVAPVPPPAGESAQPSVVRFAWPPAVDFPPTPVAAASPAATPQQELSTVLREINELSARNDHTLDRIRSSVRELREIPIREATSALLATVQSAQRPSPDGVPERTAASPAPANDAAPARTHPVFSAEYREAQLASLRDARISLESHLNASRRLRSLLARTSVSIPASGAVSTTAAAGASTTSFTLPTSPAEYRDAELDALRAERATVENQLQAAQRMQQSLLARRAAPPSEAAASPAPAPSFTLPSSPAEYRDAHLDALHAERRNIENQLQAARRMQQGLLERLQVQHNLLAARSAAFAFAPRTHAVPIHVGESARVHNGDTVVPANANDEAAVPPGDEMPGPEVDADAAPPLERVEPAPRRRMWICPAPKGGLSLRAWIEEREQAATGGGEQAEGGSRLTLEVPRPKEE
ncbi:hypothetical protein AURDEDRAFT_154023 [Auricularia subglabra TFB-10046 SS5]|nr:hypothetical protein AURDEDRAFT_154023 [Auricularia subglabra TFB-10046 SS5]